MDPKKLAELQARVDYLDERWTYRIRPQDGSMVRPTEEDLDRKVRELSNYTIELKDVLRELLEALASPSSGDYP